MILALIEADAIIVPISPTIKTIERFAQISQSEYFIDIQSDEYSIKETENKVEHPMLLELKKEQTPGLILFSSGTTGEPKAALHDLALLLEKFKSLVSSYQQCVSCCLTISADSTR